MANALIGKDFTPPDIRGKVTGAAKYAEDIRAEGMLFCRLLTSPMPHARVRNIDASAALAMEGVVDILTADEVPEVEAPREAMLTNEPHYVGEPILAVAAVDETTAQDAIDRIKLDLEPLPFTVDPLESLRPGGPNARLEGNSVVPREGLQEIKWTADDFAAVDEGQLPEGEPSATWSYGDLEDGFAKAEVVLDETFVTASNSHHSMEPRTAMAYWQGEKLFLYGSTQSQSMVQVGLAGMLGLEPQNVVYIGKHCGGGFGSKGAAFPIMGVPALMAKKTGRPVLLRISRAEEYAIGSARAGFQGRIKMGFRADGRLLACDLYIIQEAGPKNGFGDWTSAASAVSLVYTPEAMRFRGLSMATNTPPRGAQRGPGQNQIAIAVEPLLDKAAGKLGIDQFAIRRINAPGHDALYGGNRGAITSSYQGEALDKGKEKFDWAGKLARSGQRNGSKVRGVGIGQAFHSAGSNGFDGLVRLTPEGKLHIHTGVGNLGTYSYASTSRVAAEVLQCDWEHCVIEHGDSSIGLPWNLGQFGSNTSFTMTRTNHAAALDAVAKLKEIAAHDLGGSPDDYDIGDHTVFRRGNPARRLSYARAAERAIQLGGKYDGHEVAEELNPITKAAVHGLAGTGLVGVAKDNVERTGMVPALAVGFIEIELDVETGKWEILDYLGVAECGTVVHPQGLAAQVRSGAVMGFGMAAMERQVYDPHYGLPRSVGLYQAKPPSYLDVPAGMGADAVDLPDPQNPTGAKGIGEPLMGCASAALVCAISDALGGHYFNRTPVMPDMILNAASKRPQSHKPLRVNTD
ncbi:MAG: xanthine dehydrogenase family protein molybdopterin-binding subunit [Vicinamibacterales bacterium]|jgi:CO/xanthine dehydrogenase Mo-binding subunit|nr:aldehyde oxidase [Acidobacteriota bacterium]MDP7295399.1 xanthine dehydrogenase family protein molybdopterin-binding subunit [Vicinamibacterales bacterium]MDP7471536.1 xanthine dehydrogenase family protein molybdopterin-binding subunit [Vicinamibacterales bacterium]MDP7671753.1 xanthine dehydrogenase family protein molybdopterin-binding subunit [Vicinamibacterales bacterium]HJO39810.1 xanthine dehydrogenase family protein molybdopterin-binding subunit [Vicinamibacterales bacterium]